MFLYELFLFVLFDLYVLDELEYLVGFLEVGCFDDLEDLVELLEVGGFDGLEVLYVLCGLYLIGIVNWE